MKAYAPILSHCGISKEHFHDFIYALNKTIQGSVRIGHLSFVLKRRNGVKGVTTVDLRDAKLILLMMLLNNLTRCVFCT
jgi:hypothetical protein